MIRRSLPAVPRLAIALAVAAIVSSASPAAAAEAEEPGATITWSVRPSDGERPDGRSWIELELDPGARVSEHLVVTNHSKVDVEFILSAADGYFTDTGRFNMLPSDAESTDAGTWIEIVDRIEVASGESATVPFTLTVPTNATPGDHPAGVAASVRSGGDAEVGVESRVGFRVMTRVTGELAPAIAAHAGGVFAGGWNPFEPGKLTVGYAVENTGNTRLGVAPAIVLTALFGLIRLEPQVDPIVEIAPGAVRELSVELPGVWPLFFYDVSVEAAPVAVSADLPVAGAATVRADATVAAIPVSQLVVLALAGLLIALFWFERRRRQRQLGALLAEAREAGRREVVAGGAEVAP